MAGRKPGVYVIAFKAMGELEKRCKPPGVNIFKRVYGSLSTILCGEYEIEKVPRRSDYMSPDDPSSPFLISHGGTEFPVDYSVRVISESFPEKLRLQEFPTIDFQRLLDSDEELQKFDHALSSLGAFQLVNGIESFKFDQVLNISKQFVSLPIEEKQKYARSVSMLGGCKHDKLQGWGTDQMVETQAFNWNDKLMLTMYPIQFRNFKFWPSESVPNFRFSTNLVNIPA
ncbi:protein SRG1-like [Silene latifolia]|uniref:protein SRG1-like n=1 Tax=Silene latifolia TaxID=37657 RepID=UPI003D779AE9